jgi:hypothetical protein
MTSRSQALIRRIIASSAIVIWLLSLALPALRSDDRSINSVDILVTGWFGPVRGGCYGWLANPIIIVETICAWIGTRFISQLALLFAGFGVLVLNLIMKDFPATEAGTYPIQTHYAGWYLWMVAQLAALLAVALSRRSPGTR